MSLSLPRLALAAGASLAALTSLSAAPADAAVPSPFLGQHRGLHHTDADHLTVTVSGVSSGADGSFEVQCHPSGGSHPDAGGACRALERETRWGRDVFAPVARDSMCTMQYGGPATARVTGTWAGRPVDATFDRSNGCEIARWDRLVPFLPEARA
ncbi:SSI family serine proteinase inhibitor [Streptomyces spinoverrucosus]|uniref:SSI family serine proteinase inhibitor n=1 Tax=Streptomyces spinoverrucosus TaxID=284043 RepID=UPI001E3F7FFA|nr:SSI family serine proteinase inhibitor [Streptomyces spinoverrucosus]